VARVAATLEGELTIFAVGESRHGSCPVQYKRNQKAAIGQEGPPRQPPQGRAGWTATGEV